MAVVTKAGDFIEGYYRPLTEELHQLRLSNEEAGIPLILRETEDMLSLLLEMTNPKRILEIGTAYGYSSVFFATKLRDATVTTIERSENMIKEAKSNIEKFGLASRIELLEGDALDVLNELVFRKGSSSYDFVFIDAAKTHYREYVDLVLNICSPGALIVCDNILISGWVYDRSLPGAKRHRTSAKYMRSFLEYIKEREDLTVSISGGGDGLAIIKLNGK